MVNRQPRGSEAGGQFAPDITGSYKVPTAVSIPAGVKVENPVRSSSVEGSWVAYRSTTGGSHTDVVEETVVVEEVSPRIVELRESIRTRAKHIEDMEEWVEAQELKGKNPEGVFRVEETIHFEQELLDNDRDELDDLLDAE